MIRCIVYLLLIFKMVHGLMNNPVLHIKFTNVAAGHMRTAGWRPIY
jgi:hypothetical protein